MSGFENALNMISESQILTWLFYGFVILLAAWATLFILSKIKALVAEHFRPRLYNPEDRRRSARRRRFADHIESEIRRLNNLEEWRDYRFTELEAEVEAEGRR